MTTLDDRHDDVDDTRRLLARAADLGFTLGSRTTDTGQIVWEWRRGDEPRPQFVTARVALHWMSGWIADHEPGS